jgi:replicative DNA helicase
VTTIDVDYATIGGLLLDSTRLDEIGEWLRPTDFARPLCGEVYEVIGHMRGAGQPVDPVTVLGELRRRGRVRPDGYPGMELIAMIETVPAPAMTPHYARQVLEAAVFRSVEATGTRITQVGRSRRGSPEDAFSAIAGCWSQLADARERWRQSDSAALTATRSAAPAATRLADTVARGRA